jgi:hypothetical protein
MSWPPPGTSSFPQANPPTMRRAYRLSTPNVAAGFSITGPFMAMRVPSTQGLTIERDGEMVTVTDQIQMPLESRARVRCIITDIASNESYEVLQARGFATFIECLVSYTAPRL